MQSSEKADSNARSIDVDRLENGDTWEKGAFQSVELSALGLTEKTERNIGALDIICIGWNICISWAGVSATLALTIYQGGPVTLIYGIIVCFVMVGCSGLTLAELASVYPTAGGQYHWTSILAPARTSRLLSYACGVTNVYAWIAGTAGVTIINSQAMLAMAIHFDPTYAPQAWHYFLLFLAINILTCVHNIFTLKKTLWINDVAFFVTLTGFFAILITCLSRAAPKNGDKFVWTTFVNSSGGWPDGVSFLTGLIAPNYMYAGLDGAIHLCEECKDAARVVPRAIVSTLLIGFITSFAYAVSMIYCIKDFDAVLSSPFPIYEIWHQATRSWTAATAFLILLLFAGTVALIAYQQTASRLTWSFARDNAVLGSRYIGRVHDKLGVPVWALIANATVVSIIGCIFLGSTTAFNAFINTGLILQQVTYALPAALLILQGRPARFLPAKRPFRLPGITGWVVSFATVAFALVVVVFYNFPVVLPVTSSNMNYTSAVIGGMIIFAAINWFIHAGRSYQGPRLPEF